MKELERTITEKEGLLQSEVRRPNLEKLVDFAEELDADGTLIPAFLALLEMSFQGEKHCLKKLQV